MIRNFAYVRATSLDEAVEQLQESGAAVHAGGTDLLGCLRDEAIEAAKIVSVSGIKGLDRIRSTSGRGLSIGALTTVDALSSDKAVADRYSALSEAAKVVASPQLRNQGTVGGNLCQRPRCWYFRGEFDCLKKGGGKCFAVAGENQFHCIFGGGPCFIVFPSDLAPALAAFDASLVIAGRGGTREIPIAEFYALPDVDVRRENVLAPGEIVTEIRLPPTSRVTRSRYRKVRARQAWDFALASAAIVLSMQGGTIREARIFLGGVAPIPWRATEAEAALVGKVLDAETIRTAAEAAVAGAAPLEQNAYKVDLVKGILRDELEALIA